MADTGLGGSFSLGGTVFDSDDCVQSMQLTKTINGVTYICDGHTKTAEGEGTATFTASLALAKDDTATQTALERGAAGAFEYHPKGDVVTYLEYTSTNGIVVTSNISSAPGAIIMLDVTINLDDLTSGAAA